jgi:Mce-associated membrane protein
MSAVSSAITPEPQGSGALSRRRRIGALVSFLALALLVGGFFTWRELHQRGRGLDAAREAESAGRAAANHMVTYDHKTLDRDFSWVTTDGTPKFAEAFKVSADQVRQLARATSAHSEGKILASGVHVKDEDHATVLVALNSAITQPAQLSPDLQRWRVSVVLVRRAGRWLVDELNLL